MRKKRPTFKVCRVEASKHDSRVAKKWAVTDTRDGSVVSTHYFRKNAVAAAGLAASVDEYMGGL